MINYLKTAKALGLDVPATFPCLPTGAPCAPSGDQWLHEMGPLVFEHACRIGLEGIVSKRKASWYQSGRSRDWVKAKKPQGACSDATGGGGLGTIMVVKRQQETFEPVTMGRVRSHGCRDLLGLLHFIALLSQRDDE